MGSSDSGTERGTSTDGGLEDVWVVIAAYNEAARLGDTLCDVCRVCPNVVVVDDGSADGTFAVASRTPAWVLRHVVNCGQGAALQTGIDFALLKGAHFVVTFDADGQHSVADIPKLLEPLRSGRAVVALGSRFLGETVNMPWTRWLTLKAAVVFTRVVSRIRVTDTHNGLRAFARSAAESIRIRQNRMAHASEILDEVSIKGLAFCEVPVTIRYSAATLAKGQSSLQAFRVAAQHLLGRLIR